MKTIEAPEKIYLHPDIGGREFIKPWLKRRVSQESIEYTRTDAFIEKACEWWENEFTYPTMAQEEIKWYQTKIAEFKKVMKGE